MLGLGKHSPWLLICLLFLSADSLQPSSACCVSVPSFFHWEACLGCVFFQNTCHHQGYVWWLAFRKTIIKPRPKKNHRQKKAFSPEILEGPPPPFSFLESICDQLWNFSWWRWAPPAHTVDVDSLGGRLYIHKLVYRLNMTPKCDANVPALEETAQRAVGS